MRAYLVYNPAHDHQLTAITALARGLVEHGDEVHIATDWAGVSDADEILVSWGDRAPMTDRPRLMLEAGYINGEGPEYVDRRLRFVSTSWNGLHGYGDDGPNRPSDRWLALGVELKPWALSGDYILILEQAVGDAAAPPAGTMDGVIKALETKGRPLRRRPHPLTAPARPLAVDLEGAKWAVTWSSTAAVEAVIAGVPTVALDPGAIAWPVCSHWIGPSWRAKGDRFYLGPREQWAYNLAYRQWTHAELASGQAWEHIRECNSISA